MTTDTKRLRELLAKARVCLLSVPGEPAWQIERGERQNARDALADYEIYLPSLLDQIDALEARVAEAETIAGIASIPDIAGLAERLEAAERQRDDILARIHRDGGHYIEHHGVEKAVADADEIVAKLFSERDALRSTSTIIRQRDEAVEALRPFAELDHEEETAASLLGVRDGNAAVRVPRRHLRKARAFISKITGEEPNP